MGKQGIPLSDGENRMIVNCYLKLQEQGNTYVREKVHTLLGVSKRKIQEIMIEYKKTGEVPKRKPKVPWNKGKRKEKKPKLEETTVVETQSTQLLPPGDHHPVESSVQQHTSTLSVDDATSVDNSLIISTVQNAVQVASGLTVEQDGTNLVQIVDVSSGTPVVYTTEQQTIHETQPESHHHHHHHHHGVEPTY
jgi:hypothetical protein